MSDNVFNLSHRNLGKAEVSVLSKGWKSCPTPNTIVSILKEYLRKFGGKLGLKLHNRNDNRIVDPNPIKRKSKFNPPKNDAVTVLIKST